MITDPVLKTLVDIQTALFNRNASEVERVAAFLNIQARQKEIREHTR